MSDSYSCFVEDRRYSVPTLRIVVANDVTALRTLVREELLASPHYLAIEVRSADGEVILRESRDRAAQRPGP